MPIVETPANGSQLLADAQVLNSRVNIIGVPTLASGWGSFGTIVGEAADLRNRMLVPVNNLKAISINAYQYPVYDRGDTSFNARVNLEWRVVFSNPPDAKPPLEGFVAGGPPPFDATGWSWLPASAPMLLLPGIPVTFKGCCLGYQLVSIEVRAGAADEEAGEGEDLVVFSISASG